MNLNSIRLAAALVYVLISTASADPSGVRFLSCPGTVSVYNGYRNVPVNISFMAQMLDRENYNSAPHYSHAFMQFEDGAANEHITYINWVPGGAQIYWFKHPDQESSNFPMDLVDPYFGEFFQNLNNYEARFDIQFPPDSRQTLNAVAVTPNNEIWGAFICRAG